MKKIFRYISVVTIALMAAFLIVGCKAKKTTSKDDKTTVKPTTKDNTNSTRVNPTTKSNPTTKETTKKSYSISLEGTLTDVTCNVRYVEVVDGVPSSINVDFTKTYEEGTVLYVQVINDSSVQVKISATIGTTVKSEFIAAGDAGGFMGLELTGNLALKLEEAADVQIADVTITKDTSADQAGVCYNSLHFYPTADRDNELSNGSQVAYGTEVEAFCWNAASKVNFKITNGTTTVVDKVYDKLTDDQMGPGGMGHNEKFKFTVSGDVTITMTVIEEVGTKKVSINESDSYVNFSIYYFDENNQKQTFSSTTSLPIGTEIFATVTAPYDYDPIVAFAYDEDNDAYIQKITCASAGPGQDIKGTFEAITVTSDLVFDFVYDKEYTLTFSSSVEQADFYIFDVTDAEDQVMITESGKSFPVLTQLSFSVANFAENEANVIVNIYVREGYSASMTLMGSLVIEYGNYIFPEIITLETDIEVEIVEYVEYNVAIDEITETGVNATVASYDMETGTPVAITNGKYAKNTMIFAYVANASAKKLTVKFLDDSEAVLASFEVEPNDMNGLEDTFFLTSNIHITFTFGEEITYTVTFINEYSTDITLMGFNGSNSFASGDAIAAGANLAVYASNSSTNTNYVIKLMDGTTELDSDEITAFEDGYPGMGLLQFTLNSNVTIVISLMQATVEYTITYDNNYDSDITLTGAIISQEGYPTFNSGDLIEENSGIAVQVKNASTTTKYIVKAMCGTEVLDSYTIDVSDGTNPGVGGVMFTLTGNVIVVVSIYEEATTYKATFVNEYSDDIEIKAYYFDEDENPIKITSETLIPENSLVMITAYNSTTSEYYVLLVDPGDGNLIGSPITAMDGEEKGEGEVQFTITDDITIIIVYEDSTTYELTIDNGYTTEVGILTHYDQEGTDVVINSGSMVQEGLTVILNLSNTSETNTYIVTINEASTVIKIYTLAPESTIDDTFAMNGTYVIKVAKDTDVNEYSITKVFDVTGLDVTITINETEYNYDSKIEEGTTINVMVNNETEYNYAIIVVDEDDFVVEKYILKANDEGDFTFTLNEDVYITCEELYSYAIDKDFEIAGFDVTLSVDGELVDFEEDILEGSTVTISFVNNTENDYRILFYEFGDTDAYDSEIILSGESYEDEFEIDIDITLKIEEYYEDVNKYLLENAVEIDGLVISATVDGEEYEFGVEVDEYSTFEITVINNTSKDYYIYVYDPTDDYEFVSMSVESGSSITLEYGDIQYDSSIGALELGDRTITIDVASSINVTICDEDGHEIEGNTVPFGATITVLATNNSEEFDYTISVIDSNEKELDYGNAWINENCEITVTVIRDIEIISIKKVYEYYLVNEDEYDVTVNVAYEDNTYDEEDELPHEVQIAITVTNESLENTIHVYVSGDNDYDYAYESAELEAGQSIEFSVLVDDNVYVIITESLGQYNIEVEDNGIEWTLSDDNEAYESGDTVVGRTLLTLNVTNDTTDKVYKMTVYDASEESIADQYVYPGATDGCSFIVYTDILIIIEEVEVDTYTLTIDPSFEGIVLRGAVELKDGDTIYYGERLEIHFDNQTDDDLLVAAFNEDGVIYLSDPDNVDIEVYCFDAGEEKYCFVNEVYSNVEIRVVYE